MSERKTPEIRFYGFADSWEERKSGEIAPLRGGFAFKSNEYVREGVPIVRISNILSDGTVGAEFAYYDGQESDEAFSLYDGAAVLAMSGATTGKVSVLHAKNGRKYYQNQRVGYFVPTDNCDYSFVRTIVKSQMFTDQLSSVLVAGAQPNVSSKDIDEFEYKIPNSVKEQIAIGSFFEFLDNLISLHQRKLEKLQTFKQAMLEKMFPKEGSLVPEIRFRGFQGEWERASFGDVFSLLTNNTLSRADLNYEKGSVLNVHYGDILVKFREIVDIAIEQLPYITDTATTEKNIRSRLYNGDVIIADTAEDETVGKAVEVIGILNIPVVSGLHTIPCRPNLKFALKYFGFYLNSPSYRNQLFPLMQGIKVSSISKSALLNTNVLFPTDQQEQEKIGAFLDRLNSEITLLSKKLLKLQTLKQSLLQKMFV